uniref:Putative secreted protein n=1 Tax=Ixodes ricinus TaxID=34613 RepID=A0A6B0TRS7_IXORI
MPPTWHRVTLLRWLLQVRFERIPAAQVTTLMSPLASSCTRLASSGSRLSCLRAASDRLRRVQRQFSTRR